MFNEDNNFNEYNPPEDEGLQDNSRDSFPELEYTPVNSGSYSYYGGGQSEPLQPPKKKSGAGKIVALALVCALVGSVGGGAIVGGVMSNYMGKGASDEASEASAMQALEPEDELEAETDTMAPANGAYNHADTILVNTNSDSVSLTPAEIYEQYVSAVVGISNETTYTNTFGQTSSTASSGSGFIISSDGYVVTNAHVVDGAEKITVILMDETKYEAELIGADTENDIALLKIDATDLPTASVGNSDNIKVGEQVCAIGNPLGELTHTLTVGYVSSLDREINADGKPINMLQTDAAINPGNSGGPLFDAHGNVIGITTAKYSSSSSGYSASTLEGLGFAIPINDAMSVIYDLQEYGYVTGRPSFGISVLDLNLTYASYYGLPVGVMIMEVNEGSCAETAGLMQGDVITALGGQAVQTYTDLTSERKKYNAGDTVEITVYRQSEYLILSVTFDEQKPVEEPEVSDVPAQGIGEDYFNPYGGSSGGGSATGDGSSAA